MSDAVPDHLKAMSIAMTPLRRWGEVPEIAEMYCFLGADESSYVTGIDIEVAGGFAA